MSITDTQRLQIERIWARHYATQIRRLRAQVAELRAELRATRQDATR